MSEDLGFEPSGSGEHVFLHLQKRELNSLELVERLSRLAGIAQRDIGYSGLKDRNAVTRQWFSIGLAGRPEPDWSRLEDEGDVKVLQASRHLRKLRRGVHRANRFTLVLRQVEGERDQLTARLEQIRLQGVPNYFGEQRFGRNGSTLLQARRWMTHSRRITHAKRGLFYSALRAYLYNELLSRRVADGTWNTVASGDTCLLHGTRSLFTCDAVDTTMRNRVADGDVHPGLPLWGCSKPGTHPTGTSRYADALAEHRDICDFLERCGLELAWRPTRLLPDDFCWQFCDDGALQLDFALAAGGYATALLAECVQYKEGFSESGSGSEQR